MVRNRNNSPTFWNYLAGIGSGMVLTTFAQSLNGNSAIKNWLIFVIPAFTIVVSFLLNWIVKETFRFLEKRRYEKQFNELLFILEKLKERPDLTKKEKTDIKKRIISLQMANYEKKVEILNSFDLAS